MRHDFLDRYSRLDSPIHRLSTAIKLGVTLCIIATTIALPLTSLWYFFATPALLVAVVIASKIPWRFICGRILLLEPFVIGVGVMALFQHNGGMIFLTIFAKSTLCLLTIILLSNTTPFAELLNSLKRIGVPRLLITTLALMYRYIFVLIDEAERLSRARSSRTFTIGRLQKWNSLASLIGQLFVRSTERAERIFSAMSARGWK